MLSKDAVREHFNNSRDMYVEATGYYALQHLEFLINKVRNHLHKTIGTLALDKLLEDVSLSKLVVEENLSAIMFDYLALASLGEARHQRGKTRKLLSGLQWARGTDRAQVSPTMASYYDPAEFLPQLVALFDKENWPPGGYGGPKWQEIANSALRFLNKKWNAVTFIDHAVDLYHNNGLCFGKGFLLGCSNPTGLSELLKDKAAKTPIHRWHGAPNIGGEARALLKRAQNMHLLCQGTRGKWCIVCDEMHYENRNIFFNQTSNTPRKTLLDESYKPWIWPTKETGAVSIGILIGDKHELIDTYQDAPDGTHYYSGHKPAKLPPAQNWELCLVGTNELKNDFGCWLNEFKSNCTGACDVCVYNHGGCHSNQFMQCDGACAVCDEEHGGCAENGFAQCDMQCEACSPTTKTEEETVVNGTAGAGSTTYTAASASSDSDTEVISWPADRS